MNTTGARAGSLLLDVVCALLSGRDVAPEDRPAVRGSLALDGFRKAARADLVQRLLRPGGRPGDITLLFPALEGLFTAA